jgi:hypothetical protein
VLQWPLGAQTLSWFADNRHYVNPLKLGLLFPPRRHKRRVANLHTEKRSRQSEAPLIVFVMRSLLVRTIIGKRPCDLPVHGGANSTGSMAS